MKKFWTLLLLCMFMGVGILTAHEIKKSSEEYQQGANWNVIVVYNIYYSYYTDRQNGELIAEGVFHHSESLTFKVYADTADEAESEAKSQCASVCSEVVGRYVGLQSYNGKKYHAFEERKVSSARATLDK